VIASSKRRTPVSQPPILCFTATASLEPKKWLLSSEVEFAPLGTTHPVSRLLFRASAGEKREYDYSLSL
jgi:hypothetical protein